MKTTRSSIECDDETRNTKIRKRHFDRQLGSRIGRGPIGYDGGANLYEFVNSSPTSNVDPEGLRIYFVRDVKNKTIWMYNLLRYQTSEDDEGKTERAIEFNKTSVEKIAAEQTKLIDDMFNDFNFQYTDENKVVWTVKLKTIATTLKLTPVFEKPLKPADNKAQRDAIEAKKSVYGSFGLSAYSRVVLANEPRNKGGAGEQWDRGNMPWRAPKDDTEIPKDRYPFLLVHELLAHPMNNVDEYEKAGDAAEIKAFKKKLEPNSIMQRPDKATAILNRHFEAAFQFKNNVTGKPFPDEEMVSTSDLGAMNNDRWLKKFTPDADVQKLVIEEIKKIIKAADPKAPF